MNKCWSIETDKVLIDFVRLHEEIYNVKCRGHSDYQHKQKLWREIAATLGRTDYECCKRWAYLRDYYIRRKKKPGTGLSGEVTKVRSDLLSFLDRFSFSHKNSVEDDNMEDSQDNSESIKSINSDTEEKPCDNTDECKQGDNNDNFDNDPSSYRVSRMIKSKKQKNNWKAREHLSILRQLANQDDDENSLFFSSMAKIVKKLPKYEQAQIRLQIASIVGNSELRCIRNSSVQNISSSPNSSVEKKVPAPKPSTSADE